MSSISKKRKKGATSPVPAESSDTRYQESGQHYQPDAASREQELKRMRLTDSTVRDKYMFSNGGNPVTGRLVVKRSNPKDCLVTSQADKQRDLKKRRSAAANRTKRALANDLDKPQANTEAIQREANDAEQEDFWKDYMPEDMQTEPEDMQSMQSKETLRTPRAHSTLDNNACKLNANPPNHKFTAQQETPSTPRAPLALNFNTSMPGTDSCNHEPTTLNASSISRKSMTQQGTPSMPRVSSTLSNKTSKPSVASARDRKSTMQQGTPSDADAISHKPNIANHDKLTDAAGAIAHKAADANYNSLKDVTMSDDTVEGSSSNRSSTSKWQNYPVLQTINEFNRVMELVSDPDRCNKLKRRAAELNVGETPEEGALILYDFVFDNFFSRFYSPMT